MGDTGIEPVRPFGHLSDGQVRLPIPPVPHSKGCVAVPRCDHAATPHAVDFGNRLARPSRALSQLVDYAQYRAEEGPSQGLSIDVPVDVMDVNECPFLSSIVLPAKLGIEPGGGP